MATSTSMSMGKSVRVSLTEQGPQAHYFSRGSRAFPLPGGVAARMVVSPSWDDVSVGYRSTNKSVYSAKYHIIWCPKYRRRVLAGRGSAEGDHRRGDRRSRWRGDRGGGDAR